MIRPEITAVQLNRVFEKCRDPGLWSQVLSKTAVEFEINTPDRLSMWLAQCGHESMEFNAIRENLSYSVLGLMKVWPKRFPAEESARPFARQPERLENFVYANRLGNGDFASGDGWKYRGGGVLQLTGRENFRLVGKAIGEPLEEQPRKIEITNVSARVGGYFWKSHGCNELADKGDFKAVTQVINGGQTGADARLAYAIKLRALLA